MPSRPLNQATRISVKLSAIMGRNAYTDDPEPVIAQLYEVAGSRLDILTEEVGLWVGFHESEHTRTLTDALRALPLPMDDAITEGDRRRRAGHHSTTGFNGPHGTGL
jgi:hypothetical protein